MKVPNFTAFTLSENGRLNVLKTQIKILADKKLNPEFEKSREDFVAIWDTGATGSVISKELAEELKLMPVGKTKVITAGGMCDSNQYIVNLVLPNKLIINNVMITSGFLGEGTDFLVGMDIITLGDFSITNLNGKTKFSFRYPSCESIDYVNQAKKLHEKDLKRQLQNMELSIKKGGKCPCGSGKPYRYCCGKEQMKKIKNELEKLNS